MDTQTYLILDRIKYVDIEHTCANKAQVRAEMQDKLPANWSDTNEKRGKNDANSRLQARAQGGRSPSLHNALSWRHAALIGNSSVPPAKRNKAEAKQHRQGGSSARPGKVVGTSADTNLYAPIAADIASADIAEEVTVVKKGIISTSPQVVGDSTATAVEANAGIAAATINEANPIAAYSDDATIACSATGVTVSIKPTHADIHALAENATREETCRREEAEKARITTETPPKS